MCFEELDDMQVGMVVGVPSFEINGADIENGCIMAMKAKVKSVKAFNIGVGYEKRVNKHELGFGGVLLNIVCNDQGVLELPWNFRKRKKRVKSVNFFELVLGDKDSFDCYVSIFDPGICLRNLCGEHEVNKSLNLEEMNFLEATATIRKAELFGVELVIHHGVKEVEMQKKAVDNGVDIPASVSSNFSKFMEQNFMETVVVVGNVCLEDHGSCKRLATSYAQVVECAVPWDFKKYKKRAVSLLLVSLMILENEDKDERQGIHHLSLKTLELDCKAINYTQRKWYNRHFYVSCEASNLRRIVVE